MGVSAAKRERQRVNRKLGRKELDRKNVFGTTDLTPYNMVRRINRKCLVYK